ncbi:predicted protein [Histoplasma mississippiense (nom. inval.)]|uniref:predicted protein n=1 Tax=Ajellomyces capsulatus (strain NAm1 / WU24) TaxID=2059318 RepID=UPI000157C033|nr:predicted protein [Histoplasma mississippiense (nom. inval.)]EDN06627.1 predicted protein [Histoplasma mississippiense (nom. inval.)]
MATFTYDITSPGPADGSPLPQLHTVYTPDPRSDEAPQHLLPMPFSASGDLSKDAASEVFADFSALPVSGLDEINWDEWNLFDSPPVDIPPPSLQLSHFSDDPIEEAHPSPNNVADDPPNQREPTPSLAPQDREGNTSKEPLNYSDSSIEADPCPGEERHVQVHRSSEQGIPLVSGCWEGDALGETLDNQEYIILPLSQVKILKLVFKDMAHKESCGSTQVLLVRLSICSAKNISHTSLTLADDPIIIDEPMSPTNLPCGSDQFVAIPSLQRNIEKVPEGYNVYANMTLDDLQEHGGLELLVVYYYRNNERRRTRSRGLYPALLQGDGSTFPLLLLRIPVIELRHFGQSSPMALPLLECDPLQNLMLQHASIDTFVKHYLDRNITADVLSIYRGLEPQKALMRMVCSMSRSIDPRRPWKLTPEQSRSVNHLPHILKISRRVEYLKKRRDSAASWLHGRIGQRYRRKAEADDRWEKRYRRRVEEHKRWDQRHHKAVRRLRGAKQRARTLLKREILERYRQEQPVIDSERQLSGKVVDEHVRSELERYMPPELMIMIDAVLTLPPTTSAAELQRRIRAIDAVSAYCGVEEGPICRRRGRASGPKPTTAKPTAHRAEAIGQPSSDMLLESAARAVRMEPRPKICFICLQNTNLVLSDRVYSFSGLGDLTKHFQRRHLDKFRPLDCNMCNVRLATLKELLVHAETAHGTVTRSPKYRMLAQSGEPGAPTGCLPPSSQPSWSPRGNQCEEANHQGGSSMCAWKPPLVSQIIRNSSRPHLPFRFPFAFN